MNFVKMEGNVYFFNVIRLFNPLFLLNYLRLSRVCLCCGVGKSITIMKMGGKSNFTYKMGGKGKRALFFFQVLG